MTAIALVGGLCAGCDEGGPRRGSARGAREERTEDGAVAGATVVESNPGVRVLAEDAGMGTQCPGVELLRAERVWAQDAGSGRLAPRYVGRDDRGRVVSLRDVLLCELEQMHWVTTPHEEGTNLLLWRGPWLFAGDDECVWRGPWRTERTARGRALIAHERCARRVRAGLPRERTVTIEVAEDYRSLLGP